MNYKKFHNIFTNKPLLIRQAILVLVIAGGIIIFEKLFNGKLFLVNEKSKKEATLMIDFKNMQRIFEGETVENMTILDALNASVVAGKIELTYVVDNSNNTNVTKINDHAATKDEVFSFYLNRKKVNAADINKAYIYPGDKITIKIE